MCDLAVCSKPIAVVVLAAGASTRLGRPKQTLVLGGETLLRRAVRVAAAAELGPVFVVVAPSSNTQNDLREMGCMQVMNGQASEGMASSIRCGVEAAQVCRACGVVLMTCDQVALTADHLRALCSDKGAIAGSGYAGRTGTPAYFPASDFAALLKLQGDTGARSLLRGARVLVNEALAIDVDTEQDALRVGAV